MLNFRSDNLGTWFYYDPDDEDQGGVCLRELTIDESNRIEKITVKSKKKVIRGVAVDDKKVDEKMASRMRWDFCITDWSKTSLDGRELECTSENKAKMMKVTDFVKIVVDGLMELTESNKALEEAKLKNSQSSSNGSSENQTAPSA